MTADTVPLKNGSNEPNATVVTTMLLLEELARCQPILLYELFQVCRDTDYKMFGGCGGDLARMKLLQSNHKPHETVQNIVLSALVPAGFDFKLQDPRIGR